MATAVDQWNACVCPVRIETFYDLRVRALRAAVHRGSRCENDKQPRMKDRVR